MQKTKHTFSELVHDGLSLDELKDIRKSLIDHRSAELIAEGFDYTGVKFSMSTNAQANNLGLHKDKDAAHLTYPFVYASKDNKQFVTINNSSEMNSMYLSAFSHKMSILGAGNVLKQSIHNAVDKAAVDAIVDNR